MSRTVELCCMACKEALWIGQIVREGHPLAGGGEAETDYVKAVTMIISSRSSSTPAISDTP